MIQLNVTYIVTFNLWYYDICIINSRIRYDNMGYPLVNVDITMEHHHFWWVNQLFRLGHVSLPEGMSPRKWGLFWKVKWRETHGFLGVPLTNPHDICWVLKNRWPQLKILATAALLLIVAQSYVISGRPRMFVPSVLSPMFQRKNMVASIELWN